MHDQDASECLKHWGTPQFSTELADLISQHYVWLSLDEHCRNGGSPDTDIEVCDLTFERDKTSPSITGSFSVSFTESTTTGCSKIGWHDAFSGTMSFTLDLQTGAIDFYDGEFEQVHEDEPASDDETPADAPL